MNRLRRNLLRTAGALTSIAGALAALPRWVFAATWNQTAFDATELKAAMAGIGIVNPIESKDIAIKVQDIAENGARVPVEVTSRIPDTRSIAIFVDKNPFPLIGQFALQNGADGFVSTYIKMGESSNIKAVVEAEGKFYVANRDVKVTIGGCA